MRKIKDGQCPNVKFNRFVMVTNVGIVSMFGYRTEFGMTFILKLGDSSRLVVGSVLISLERSNHTCRHPELVSGSTSFLDAETSSA